MAQQDNTLGAPTEGLGQTVTFAIGGQPSVQQTQAVQRGQFRMNAQGGVGQLTSMAQNVQKAEPDATFTVLAKLAGAAIQPKIEEARNAAYLEGMRKVQQGQALQEVKDEQPFLSQLFGATPVVEGARAYTASATSINIASELESSLEETRKMEGPEYSKHVAGILAKHTTGDTAVDLMVAQQAARTVPQAMKNQAKANVKYKADLRRTAEGTNADAGFAALGLADASARDPESIKSDLDVIESAAPLLDAFVVPEGRDAADYNRVLAASAVKAIQSGNFAAYDLLHSTKKFAEFSPDEQYHIDRAHRQATAQARLTLPLEFGEEVANWKAMSDEVGTDNPAMIAAAQQLNERYTKITGDRTQYLTHTTVASELLQKRTRERAEDERAQRAIAAAQTVEQKKQAELDLISERATRVAAPGSMYIGDLPGKEKQAVFNHIASYSPDTYHRVLVEQAKMGQYDEARKDIMAGNFANAIATGNREMFLTEYRKYTAIVNASGNNGAAYADAYAGPEKERVALYHSIAQGRELTALEAEGAFQQVINPPPKPATGKKAAEIAAELTSNPFMGVAKGVLGDFVPIKDPAGLRDLLMPSINTYLPADEAIKAARKQHPTLTEIGGYHWQSPVTSTPLKRWLIKNPTAGGVTQFSWNKAFAHTVDTLATSAGIEDSIKVYQGTDTTGEVPQMFVIGIGSDSNVKIIHFDANEINRLWAEKNVPVKTSFGPAITYKPAEGQPSIYASPAEWEAYRAKQRANQ